jgi:hypothetical protein
MVIVSRRQIRLQTNLFAALIFRHFLRPLHAMTTGKKALPIAHGTPLVLALFGAWMN